MNVMQKFAAALESDFAYKFGDKVRRKDQRETWLVTGSEWVERGDGSIVERVYLARFKAGSQEWAHNLVAA